MGTLTVTLSAICLLLVAAIDDFAGAHGDHYNVYYLNEYCVEYFDEFHGEYTPLTINVRNPESGNPLSTAVITWSRYKHPKKTDQANCTLKIAHSTLVPEEYAFYQFKLNGKVGLTGLASCKDHVEVSVGEFGEWASVYHSCETTKDEFTFATKNHQIIRVRAHISETSVGLPFEFVITAFREKGDDGCGGLFSCKNDLCINKALKCDHRDNCGDASDEAEEFNCPPMEHDHDEENENNWLILGLVLGGFFVVFFGIALSIFLIAGRYGEKAKKKSENEAETGEPEVTTPLQEIPRKTENGDAERDVTNPEVTPPFQDNTDGLNTNVVTYSEPTQMEVEAENPLYESADSSTSSSR